MTPRPMKVDVIGKDCAMTRDQKIVAIGSASGVLTMVAAVTAIFWLWPSDPLLADTPMRLGYTIQADAFAVIPLLLGILAVANARFLGDAIDPTLQKENMAMLAVSLQYLAAVRPVSDCNDGSQC
jgi:hypothetical protein